MKKLLTFITILLCLDAAAQTTVNDTAIVRAPFTVSRSGGTSRDTLRMPAATTSQDGFATAASLANIANLQTSMTTLNSSVAGLQTDVANAGTPKGLRPLVATSYTLVADDNGRLIDVNSSTTSTVVTITIPAGLPDGFTCDVLARRGNITFVAGSGATISSALNYRRSQTPNALITIKALTNNVAALSGNLRL